MLSVQINRAVIKSVVCSNIIKYSFETGIEKPRTQFPCDNKAWSYIRKASLIRHHKFEQRVLCPQQINKLISNMKTGKFQYTFAPTSGANGCCKLVVAKSEHANYKNMSTADSGSFFDFLGNGISYFVFLSCMLIKLS